MILTAKSKVHYALITEIQPYSCYLYGLLFLFTNHQWTHVFVFVSPLIVVLFFFCGVKMNICVLVFCVLPYRLDWSLLSAHGTILWEISQLEILHRAVHMARCGHWAGFRAIRNPAGLLFSTTGGAIAHLARGGDRTVRHLEWRREFHMKRRCKLRDITPLIHTLEYRTLKTNG